MRAKGRSPTSAIAPPAPVGNNSFKEPAISDFHCRAEDVNRASIFQSFSPFMNDEAKIEHSHVNVARFREANCGCIATPSPVLWPLLLQHRIKGENQEISLKVDGEAASCFCLF
jgi:hypothetical protein